MRYITGLHTLNLPCFLLTCGDWHQSAIQWEHLMFRESEHSFFGDYGIEREIAIPGHAKIHPVANHIRALLDFLAFPNKKSDRFVLKGGTALLSVYSIYIIK
jgi:hypothetical protein